MVHEFKISPINAHMQLHAVELGKGYGYREVGYVLILQNRTILIDLADHRILPLIQKFHVPEILILTHKHTRKDEAFFERVFDTKIYLATEDVVYSTEKAAPELAKRYRNPFKCPDLEALGFTFKRIEGHTAGSTLVIHRELGLFFSGDSLVGSKEDSEENKIELPPAVTCENFDLLKENVELTELHSEISKLNYFLPLHGKPIVGSWNTVTQKVDGHI